MYSGQEESNSFLMRNKKCLERINEHVFSSALNLLFEIYWGIFD